MLKFEKTLHRGLRRACSTSIPTLALWTVQFSRRMIRWSRWDCAR